MIEVQFNAGGELLRGHLHLPLQLIGQAPSPGPAALIIPGFADTAVGPHNMHMALARMLAQEGYVVLRFDYRGQGESDGDFRHFTALSGLEDALAALSCLCRRPEVDAQHLTIVGFSLGGALACELAATDTGIERLLLLAPVAYPQRVFRTFFTAQHLAQGEEQGWIDWLGWAVGQEYLPSLAHLHPLHALRQSSARALVIQGTADLEVLPENGAAYASQGAEIRWLEHGDHQFASVRLQQAMLDCAQAWLRQ